MTTGAWIFYIIMTAIFVFATVICLIADRNPRWGQESVERFGKGIYQPDWGEFN